MAAKSFTALTGFRDFTPRDCSLRNYLFETWRTVARTYGFVEYDTPVLEDTGLYLKKSGGELSSQLFRFEDQGGRDVCLRPEVTASLARLAAQHQRDFPKPLKWFEIGQCYRYEKPQKGRGREFYQFNVDILGEAGPQADAELIALAIDTMRAFGFKQEDFMVRVSDRQAWLDFAAEHKIDESRIPDLLQVIDKLERAKPEVSAEKLEELGLDLETVQTFIRNPESASFAYESIRADLEARGLDAYIELDLSIVRGLAYYTGVVFEVFDRSKSMRAVAGGGRYDTLVSTISNGSVDMPATGFAMGDYVIRNFIEETTDPRMQLEVWLQRQAAACDVFLVLADEDKRPEALNILSDLRQAGISCDMTFTGGKVGKQFQRAEQSGARFALVIGSELPELKLKVLACRTEETCHVLGLADWLTDRIQQPDGPLLA
ncbi:histidine--tRNA ligase [Haloferula rosea]|uniref:Histidine--tRNA ligase n=1 Tax=Haloferula rosea TaxID=490093 RepID=A0A934R8N9_9BACT|nr:histidine--tRNA ligase [Haloferula rosea]MBK1825955.1 histidine--tRNA ligase [Haloferula rosea]